MKLRKLKLNEASKAELNEREMCRVLGGGTIGCCQCGCNYEGKPGGSSTSANDSANNAHGYTSDGSHPCCSTTDPKPEFPEISGFSCYASRCSLWGDSRTLVWYMKIIDWAFIFVCMNN